MKLERNQLGKRHKKDLNQLRLTYQTHNQSQEIGITSKKINQKDYPS